MLDVLRPPLADPVIGLTVRVRGGGYAAVCLACPRPARLRMVVSLRSYALHALALHDLEAHAPARAAVDDRGAA